MHDVADTDVAVVGYGPIGQVTAAVVGHIIGADLPAPDIATTLSSLPTGPAAPENGLLDPCRRVGSGTVALQPVVTFGRTTARADDRTPRDQLSVASAHR